MAGIGFELRKMIEERRGLVAKVRAYACAGLISSGPWLMTILTLLLLSLVGPALGSKNGYSLFRALVTYAFAFSLIVTGIAQMSVTRRVAVDPLTVRITLSSAGPQTSFPLNQWIG